MAAPDVLLHPVRLRVIQALLGDRTLTTAQLAAELPEVPKPTLYRHIGALLDASVLQIAAERRIRGGVERTYRLDQSRAAATPQEAAAMTDDERRAGFAVFTAGLAAAYDASLARGDEAAYGYRTAAVHLRADDTAEFARRVRAAIEPWLVPAEGADRFLFSTVLIPATTGEEYP
jgi:predicted DNA-binding transcriptional regulator YafY